jgi:hypothetical protein
MKAASTIAVLVPLCILAGCRHKVQATPPPAAQVYSPSAVAGNAPPPQLPPPKQPDVKPPAPDVAKQPPPPKAKKQPSHKPKPTEATQAAKDAAAQAATQQASAGQPPEMSPIGQLSSSGEHSGVPSRHAIQELINNVEKGLSGIEPSLAKDEKLTATQIHTFLTKAQQALDQDDLDGANTLATKAKVLLSELTKG